MTPSAIFSGTVMLPTQKLPSGAAVPSFHRVASPLLGSAGSGAESFCSMSRGTGVGQVEVDVRGEGAGRRTMSCWVVAMN